MKGLTLSNILLCRVDDRLIHGQVGIIWTRFIKADYIIVVDDEVALDPMQQLVLSMNVPQGVKALYYPVENAAGEISKLPENSRIILITGNLENIMKLIDKGLLIGHLNIGNMPYEKGKTAVTSSVYVNQKDIDNFKKLKKMDISCELRRVPFEPDKNIFALLNI